MVQKRRISGMWVGCCWSCALIKPKVPDRGSSRLNASSGSPAISSYRVVFMQTQTARFCTEGWKLDAMILPHTHESRRRRPLSSPTSFSSRCRHLLIEAVLVCTAGLVTVGSVADEIKTRDPVAGGPILQQLTWAACAKAGLSRSFARTTAYAAAPGSLVGCRVHERSRK